MIQRSCMAQCLLASYTSTGLVEGPDGALGRIAGHSGVQRALNRLRHPGRTVYAPGWYVFSSAIREA